MSTSEPSAPPAKPRRLRWVVRIVTTLAALVLLVGAVVQIVLWTNLPRNIVVAQLEKQLGLRLTVDSLTTGWLGNTELNRVTIALPLADKAFLDVPVMKVKNTTLFGLILGRPVEVQAIELDQPHLFVRQDPAGQWNLQQVAELLARAGGKKSGEDSAATSSSPSMPRVHLARGVVTIVDNQGRSVDVSPLSVEGYADSGVSWKYDVEIPSHLAISGKLVPGGNWAHQVTIHIQDVAAWAKPWNANPPVVQADLEWNGAMSDAGVGGRLDVHRFVVSTEGRTAEAYGALAATQTADGFSIRPDNLLLKTGSTSLPQFKLVSGAILFTPASHDLKADQLLVGLFGGSAKINAGYNLSTGTAQLNAEWEKLALTKDISHSGGLALTLRKPFPDKVAMEGHLTSAGWRGPGAWLASMNFSATGKSLVDLDWTLNADQLEWQRHVQGINLAGLTLTGSLRDNTLSIASIALPRKDLIEGKIEYGFTGDHPWKAAIHGQHWPFQIIRGTELGFEFGGHGNDQQFVLDNFMVKSPDVAVGLHGTYTFGEPKPLAVVLTVNNALSNQPPIAVASSTPAKVLNGTIDGNFQLAGTLDPLQLSIGGTLDGREVDIRGHHLGNILLTMAKESRVDANGVFLHTEQLALLGGQWSVDGVYVPDWNNLTIDLAMKGASLKEIGAVVDQKNIEGTIDGKIAIAIPGLNFDPKNIGIARAPFVLHDVKASGIEVDQIDATVALDRGRLMIDPIHLRRQEGTGDLHFAADLSNLRDISGGLKFSNWPYEFTGAEAHINASLAIPELTIQLPDPHSADPSRQKLGIRAPQITFDAAATLRKDKIGELVAYAGMDGGIIDMRGVHAEVLGGRLDGQAYGDVYHPLHTTAEFTWQNLEFEKLALIFPQLKDMHGKINGGLRIQPPTAPHPLAPLALVITSRLDAGKWRTLAIKDARIAAYFGPNTDMPEGGWRIVLDDGSGDSSYIHMAGGTVGLWGRFGFRGRASTSQILLAFRNLDLNQIVHALDPTAAEMKARLAGNITLLRAPPPPAPRQRDLDRSPFPSEPALVVVPVQGSGPKDDPLRQLLDPIYGEGHIELSQANLLNFRPFAFVYNAAHLFQNHKSTKGSGNGDFHLERGSIALEHLRYFNVGTEIRTVATIQDMWRGAESPLNATVTLTAKPLAGTKLPLFSDLNTALTTIQNSLPITAARVDGTVGKPITHQLGISQLGQQMRQFIVSDAQGGGE